MSSPARGPGTGETPARVGEEAPERATEAPEPSGEGCEICGAGMYGLHCKLVCPNCGYRRDCSDP